jgi:chemotaxis protein methyltransferase CheR
MAPDDFHFLARLLRRRSGLLLGPSRRSLTRARLAPVVRRFGFKDEASLIQDLRLGRESLADAVVEAMTVQESGFFREAAQFGALRSHVLPRLLKARQSDRKNDKRGEKKLRIWSAATAAGPEAYSIAMILSGQDLLRDGWRLDIIATDISADAIARAESGRYSAHEIERAPELESLSPWLRRDGVEWVVAENLRRMVRFRRFNLLDSFGWLDDLDVVFCRNVLMYFDADTRNDVLARIADTLAPDGVLFLGEHEMAGRAFTASEDGPGIYVRKRLPLAAAFRPGRGRRDARAL